MRSQLTPAQKDVLLYLRTLDPFGDKTLDIGIRALARDMGLNPSTVSRAMEVLRDKEYIDLEISAVRVKVKSLRLVRDDERPCGKVLPTDNTVVSTQQMRSQCNTLDPDATLLIAMQHLSSETQSEQGVQISKTLKTIKTDQTINQECQEAAFHSQEERPIAETTDFVFFDNQEQEEHPILESRPERSTTTKAESMDQISNLIDMDSFKRKLPDPGGGKIENEEGNNQVSEIESRRSKPTEEELFKFAKHQIESKGIEMRSPEKYVKAVIARERDNLIKQWQEIQRASLPVEVWKPEKFEIEDPEAGRKALADARAILVKKGLIREP